MNIFHANVKRDKDTIWETKLIDNLIWWVLFLVTSLIIRTDNFISQLLLRRKKSVTLVSICMYPANIYLLKPKCRNTRRKCEKCSNLTIKTPERRQWRQCHMTYFTLFSSVSIIDFEQVNVSWVYMASRTYRFCW